MQVDPAVGGQVEEVLRDELSVGDDGDDVGLERGYLRPDGLVAQGRRGEHRQAELLSRRADRRGEQGAATAGASVWAGEDGDDLVRAVDESPEGGDGHLGGPGKDHAHAAQSRCSPKRARGHSPRSRT